MHVQVSRRASLLALVVPVIGLGACGGGSHSLSVKETEPAKDRYAYQGVKSIDGGKVTIKLTNKGKVQHEVQLVKADGNHSAAEVKAVLSKISGNQSPVIPDWLHAEGGVAFVKPGKTGTSTVALGPGKYYAVDTDSNMQSNGPAYLTQGAFASFDVKGGKSTAALPKGTASIVAKDVPGDKHAFDDSGLKVGGNTVSFDNNSEKEDHHFILFPLLPGKTLADAKKFLATQGQPSGPPPVDFDNGVGSAVIGAKQKETLHIDLPRAGNYVLLCFVTDRDGKGPPHFLKGMLKEVKVS